MEFVIASYENFLNKDPAIKLINTGIVTHDSRIK